MLIIRRRTGESVLIGENVEVEILEVAGGQVKLGIRAPRNITVLRHELMVTMQENAVASAVISEKSLGDLADLLRDIPSNVPKHCR